MDIIARVKQSIGRYELLEAGDSVLVALSGGPDSVALLHLLNRLRRTYKLTLSAVYINHQIRPRSARKEERFCHELCGKLDVNFLTVSADIPKLARQSKTGVEESGRNFRYEQFDRLAKELNCNKVAVGHHVDDRVETLLFRVLRGTGRTGLQGIPVRRGKIIRPLFDITKKDILQYLKAKRMSYCEDQSNTRIEHTRNFIRNRLLPLVRERINANVDGAILNLVETIEEEEKHLEKIVDAAYRKCVTFTRGGKLVLALERFKEYALWEQRRLVRRCIAVVSNSITAPDRKVVERVLVVANGGGAVSLPDRIQCSQTGDALFFFKKKKTSFSRDLPLDGRAVVRNVGLTFVTSIERPKKEAVVRRRRSSNVFVDFDKISPPLFVRSIRNGDRFRPLGLKGTKKIGDYLTDRKVNQIIRDEIPVVTDAEGIIWLVGFEIAERVKIDNKTKKVLKLGYSHN